MPLEDLSQQPRTSDAPVPEKEECEAMFGEFLKQHQNDKHAISSEEAEKFKTAFDDPKFREILADYMDEISDPKYREETEAYITQLENDEKVCIPTARWLIFVLITSFQTLRSLARCPRVRSSSGLNPPLS